MASIDEYLWVRRIMEEVIGKADDLVIRASGTTLSGPELEMGLYKGGKVERLQLRTTNYDLNERPDREQHVREWTVAAVERLTKK